MDPFPHKWDRQLELKVLNYYIANCKVLLSKLLKTVAIFTLRRIYRHHLCSYVVYCYLRSAP